MIMIDIILNHPHINMLIKLFERNKRYGDIDIYNSVFEDYTLKS